MRRGLIVAALVAAVSIPAGCAYFNLFYNAQQAFGEAEDLGKNIDPRNQPTSTQKSKYRTCIAKCELVLEEYPDSGYVDDALFLMGKSYLRLKEASNYRSAIQNFDLVLSNFPNSEFAAESLYLKSLAHLALGEEQIALDDLARLQESEEGGQYASEALFQLGDAYLERKEYRTAIGYYDRYLAEHPRGKDAATVALHKADAAFEMRDYESVVTALQSMNRDRATRRESFDGDFLLARALHRSGRSEEAAAVLDRIAGEAETYDQRPEMLILLGEIELARGREEEGFSILRDLAAEFSRKPTESEARWTIANYYVQRYGPGDERLLQELDAAVESNPGGDAMADIRGLRARVVRYLALRDTMQSTNSDSLRASTALDLGELLLTELDRPREALDDYRAVLDAETARPADAARAAYAVAFIYDQLLDRPDSAQIVRAELKERFPESLQARSLGGESFLQARPKTEEEIAAILAGDFTSERQGGESRRGGFAGRASRSGFRRSLARGGPGATQPREVQRR